MLGIIITYGLQIRKQRLSKASGPPTPQDLYSQSTALLHSHPSEPGLVFGNPDPQSWAGWGKG